MKPIRAFAIVLYNTVAIRLPLSNSRLNLGARRLRAFCARHMLAACGRNVNVERHAHFGRGVTLGDNSGIGVNASVGEQTHIGNDVMMGPDCLIYTTMHRFDRADVPMREQGYTPVRPVVIEDDCWIGARVVIMPGVTLGRGCVVGTGAVVTHDVPPYAVVGGVPARILKYRSAEQGDEKKQIEENEQ